MALALRLEPNREECLPDCGWKRVIGDDGILGITQHRLEEEATVLGHSAPSRTNPDNDSYRVNFGSGAIGVFFWVRDGTEIRPRRYLVFHHAKLRSS
jgi:hypothetical protein